MGNGSQAPQRKGLHPLAWVGIGCGVVLVMVVVVVGALALWGYGKAKEAGLDPASIREKAEEAGLTAEDFRQNPELAAVKMLLLGHPELEAVEVDSETGLVQVRNKKTGELYTLDLQDVQNGNIRLSAGDEEIRIDVSEAEGGTVKIESSTGEGFALSTGAAVSEDVPEWVPTYPDAEPSSRSMMTSDEGTTGSFQLETGDAVSDVIAFYRDRLKAAGFEISVNTFSGEGSEGGMVQATLEAEKRSVMVMISRESGPTQVSVTYSAGP